MFLFPFKSPGGHVIYRRNDDTWDAYFHLAIITPPPTSWRLTPFPLTQRLYVRAGVRWRHNQIFLDR